MRYLPKSSIQVLEANVGELVYINSRRPFVGTYIKTSEGKFFAGSNSIDLGPELEKPDKSNGKFGNTRTIKKFNILNKNKYNKLKKYKSIIPSKSRPTESDYEKGYMYRYFAQRTNDEKQIFEISKKSYDDFPKNHDPALYFRGYLIWTLEGNVRKSNKLTLSKNVSKFKYIERLFPLLNEFESMENIGNLYTKGGELFFEDGREYVGPYHIHGERDEGPVPMVGARHKDEPHEVLIWAKDLQSPKELKGLKDLNYQKFLKERKKKQLNKFIKPEMRPTTSRRTPPRTSPRTTSTGGGGY